jgi:hypothetical protein
MASKVIIDMLIKKKSPHWEPNPSCPHCRQTHYQLNYCGEHKGAYFYEACELTLKEVENNTVYYKETVEC